ncbi:MAG TPA: 2Fe-2S iron-sulfur cluster-binding protein [Pyrinomonadaceae bacterium]|jgi:xanthine dehydrogenase YagT iron-sulfur-binding subunit|nr:2Fe-2S iron-sulfur cluster-binding protein [Pyrinomonadaceae bacterium]
MEREEKRDEGFSGEGTQAREPSEAIAHGDVGEADLLLSEDGEARRRFLKRALIAGGGLAAANLLLRYQAEAAAQTHAAANVASTQAATGTLPVTLRVNGKTYALQLEPQVTLLDALRERVGLTGSKKGCDRGQCGACTVLADGRRINSCLALAAAYEGAEITTIEGLARGDELHPVQAAFIRHDGFQCGYCTPGQIMSAVGLLREGCPEGMTVRECMSGNICRCGAYNGIVAAVEEVRGAKA